MVFERAYETQDFSKSTFKTPPKVLNKKTYMACVPETGIPRLLTVTMCASKFWVAVEISIITKFGKYSFRGRLMSWR